MNTVIEIMKSIVKMNNWTVTRFDIQHYKYEKGIEGYVGYLDIEESKRTLIIRHNGTFEYLVPKDILGK